jgi:hypothetical protein
VLFYIWNKIISSIKKNNSYNLIRKHNKQFNDAFKESDIKGKTISFEQLTNIMDRETRMHNNQCNDKLSGKDARKDVKK